MLNVGILRARPYATAVVIIVIVQAALLGAGVITPLYIQGVLGFSATMSGVAMLPGAVIGAFMGLVRGACSTASAAPRGDSWRYRGGAGGVGLARLGIDAASST